MEDFPGLLARDFGFRPQGKSAPMKSSSSSSLGSGSASARPNNHPVSSFDDVFGGPPKRPIKNQPPSFDSFFDDPKPNPNPKPKYSSMPVYDDDIFDGAPGIKSSPAVKVEYEDVFASLSKGGRADKGGEYDDLLGNLGSSGSKKEAKRSEDLGRFEELISGFGGSSPSSRRDHPETNRQKSDDPSNKATASVPEDPFAVLETTSGSAHPSSGMSTNPLENLGRPMNSGSATGDASPLSGGVFDDIDAFDGLGKSVPASTSEKNEGRKDMSPLKSGPNITQERSFVETFDNDIPKTQSRNPFDSRSNPENLKSNGSPEHLETVDDVWLTVSEIPLFTQPTRAPPPSRPPPPVVIKSVPYGRTGPRRKDYESYSKSSRGFSYPKGSVRRPGATGIDELEDFALNKPQANQCAATFSSEHDNETNSAAAASAAAMKEAMDMAEAKFKHAKEVRERDARSSRSREFAQERDEEATPDIQDTGDKERGENLESERLQREREEREREKRRLQKERELERERNRQAVERATREARDRAAAEARARAERAAVNKVNAEARQRAEKAAFQRAAAEARDRASERAAAEAREKAARERAAAESRLRAERVAIDRAHAEARERAAAAAREKQYKTENDLESFFGLGGHPNSTPKQRATTSENIFDTRPSSRGSADGTRRTSPASSSGLRKASSATNIVDDLSSIFGGVPSSGGEFQEIEGESEERRRARLERHERTLARAAQALAEKNERDMQTQREQAERDRIGETLDIEIKRWAAGKEGNLRALLSTLQYVLWPECGWQAVSLTDLITAAAVKKVYRKATLCIHPDKVQQKGANLQQKYIAEKVFDLLKEAWNKFNSEELF